MATSRGAGGDAGAPVRARQGVSIQAAEADRYTLARTMRQKYQLAGHVLLVLAIALAAAVIAIQAGNRMAHEPVSLVVALVGIVAGSCAALALEVVAGVGSRRRAFARGVVFVLATALACAAAAVAGGRAVQAPVLSAVFVAFFAGGAAFAALLDAPATPKQIVVRVVQLDRFTARPRWTAVALLAIVGAALLVRLWHFNDVGYNSDEAVYAGQGAGIAHDSQLAPYFPVFRAHPLLFQSVVAIGYELHQGDWFGRAAAIAFGALCVLATFELGRLLYGVRAGLTAAAVIAVMPYHVVVSRQVLLDGPQAFFLTLTLCLLTRFARSGRTLWLVCTGAAMGLSVLAKEPSVIFCGAVYAFFALSPEIRIRLRAILISLAVMVITILPYPVALALSGQAGVGGNFLAWQLVRQPNHSLLFYVTAVPKSIGFAVCALAALSIIVRARRRTWSWRETLVCCWIGVPLAFLELWPVKGFQYLLPLAPVIAVLAADGLARVATAVARTRRLSAGRLRPVLAVALLATLAVPTYAAVAPSSRVSYLAGSGGVPGGRETGAYIQAHVPAGATLLTLGPSMANILEFYGHRQAYGLSVSPNSSRRNPIYHAVANPDAWLRRGDIQYIVWDAFSARRSAHFERRLLSLVSRYRGRAVYTYNTSSRDTAGKLDVVPLIIVYAVRP
jgi:hypothetical protein